MFTDTVQLYPTPKHIIERMVKDIDFRAIETCLEPSIGTCSIADYINEKIQESRASRWKKNNDYRKNIYACEISNDLQILAREKGYRIIGDDFLSYNTYQHFDLICMNPPFHEGDKHLIKAIQIAEQNNGAKIRCVLNAETLKNPYSNLRKLLLQKIEQYEGSVEYIQDAFIQAERKTDVEIAIVKIDVKPKYESIIINNLRKENDNIEIYNNDRYEVGERQDFIEAICKQYQNEVKMTVNLIKEYWEVSKLMLEDFNEESEPILQLRINGNRDYLYNKDILNDTIKQIRYKYWRAFLGSDKLRHLMTSNIREQWYSKLEELKEYDFSLFNVQQVEHDIKISLSKGIKQTILDLFDKFTRYAMQDGTKNIHYFTGWKSNNAYRLSNKIIQPYLNVFDGWCGTPELNYNTRETLIDIEKTFSYIDSGVLQMDHVEMETTLRECFKKGVTRDIELTYFKISFYKKGTAHIEFKGKYQDVIDRFNYIAAHLKNWLPNSFGKKSYREMNKEEQEVVKSYCGSAEVYENEVMSKPSLYDFQMGNIKLIS